MDQRIYEQLHEIESRHWWFVGRRRFLLAALKRTGVGASTILDVGCGAGTNLDFLAEYYPNAAIHGLDIEMDPLRFCQTDRDLPVVRADAAVLPFAPASFDLVCALDALEHTQDDMETLRNLYRVCRPGGTLLATVPAFPFLWGNIDEAGQHFRRYRRKELEEKVAAAGFSIRFVRFFNFLLFPPIAAIRLAARLKPARDPGADPVLRTDFDTVKGGPLNSILASLFSIESQLLPLRVPFGVSLLCIAARER